MAIDNILNEDQIDYFQELINIAFGRAAGLLNELTGKEVRLHIPKVKFENYDTFVKEVTEDINEPSIVSKQTFNGKISGETMMTMSRSASESMAMLINETDNVTDKQILSTVYEIGNIITTTSTKTLSDLAKVPLVFNAPETSFQDKEELIASVEQHHYTNVITISTFLDIPEASIKSKIYYLFHQDSVDVLSKALNI